MLTTTFRNPLSQTTQANDASSIFVLFTDEDAKSVFKMVSGSPLNDKEWLSVILCWPRYWRLPPALSSTICLLMPIGPSRCHILSIRSEKVVENDLQHPPAWWSSSHPSRAVLIVNDHLPTRYLHVWAHMSWLWGIMKRFITFVSLFKRQIVRYWPSLLQAFRC